MTAPFTPNNEASRLATLRQYGVLDTLPEQALDDLTALAASICNTPISAISLVDEHRLWFKSRFGLKDPEIHRRADTFCAHAIRGTEIFIVPDAALDERFSKSPLVTEGPKARFYAGAPLISNSGNCIGTLCVLDDAPRDLDEAQKNALAVLSRQIMAHFELRFQADENAGREHRLTQALDAARMGTFDWEFSTDTVVWDGVHLELWDYTPEEFDGTYETVRKRFHPDDHDSIVDALEHCKATNTQFNEEFRVVWSDGSVHWMSSQGECAFDDSGTAVRMRGVVVETTERRKAEETLRDQEAFLQDTGKIAKIGGWSFDPNTNKASWTDEAPRIYDLEPGEPIPELEEQLALYSPDSRKQIEAALELAISSGVPYDLEADLTTAQGNHKSVRIIGFPENGEGPLHKVKGTIQDISERKRREATAQQNKYQLSSIVSSIEGIVWEADAESLQVSFVSPRAELILGIPSSRWIDEIDFWQNQIHPDDRDETIRACKAKTEKNQNYELEYRILTANGNAIWIRDIVTVIAQEGQRKKLRGVMIDISEQKESEKRIQSLNRTHAVLSDINQVILREKDQAAFLSAVCKSAVEIGKFKMAWVGLKNPNDNALKIEAHAGVNSETLELLNNFLGNAKVKPACHFTVTALEEGIQGTCNDIEADPRTVDWRHVTTARDIFSVASLPIKSGETVIGTINLYSSEIGFFDENEIRLLDELAQDVSFALEFRNREAERFRISQDLQRSESQLSNALKIAELGYWEFDGINNVVICNDRLYELLRTSLEKEGSYKMQTSRFIERFIHPDDLHVIEKEIRKSQELEDPNQPSSFELRYILGDGSIGHFALRTFTEKDTRGKVVRTYGVSQNITERKLAEEAINRVHRRYRGLIEHSVDIVSLLDIDGNVLYISPSVTKVEGYTPEELVARNFVEKIHPEDAQIFMEAFEKVAATPGASAEVTVRSRHKDGRWLWMEGVGTNLLEDPAVGAIVANYRDVTSRKELEEELLQSQKLDAIGQLAGGVAHDFNNILTIIHGYGSMLLMEDGFSEENTESVNQIIEASERATNLTRQLLAFSRRQVMQPRTLDLNESVTSLTRMLQRILGEDVGLQLNLHPEILSTRADAGMLDQILMNLVVNARDAMPDGGELKIETGSLILSEEDSTLTPVSIPGPHVYLSVTDNGTGIPTDDLSHIFEPFFTTKEQGKGTGLGLATVFGIVKQHNGALSVTSEPGEGTTFQILLPVYEDSDILKQRRNSKPAPQGRDEVILLVEDENPVRNLVRTILERSGYQVLEAIHGVEALEVWKENSETIQLLLTDIVMPKGISGLELANILTKKDPSLRVVFTSGYSADIAGRELDLNEGQNFIQKPASRDQLLEIVRQSLDEEVASD